MSCSVLKKSHEMITEPLKMSSEGFEFQNEMKIYQ